MDKQILDEVFENLREHRPDLEPRALARTRELMVCAVRDCLVTGYEPLVAGLELPDRMIDMFWPLPSEPAPR